MADTTSRIRIVFDGAVEGLTRAARAAENAINRLGGSTQRQTVTFGQFVNAGNKLTSGLLTVSKAFAVVGGAAATLQGAVAVVGTLASVTAQLAPAALAVPGVILGLATAYGVAKLALTGFTDAVKGDAEALANFSAEGQKTVLAVRGLESGFKAMRSAVQQSFFKGLAAEVTETGKAMLDLGKKELPAVAEGLRGIAFQALETMRAPLFKGSLRAIIQDTAAGLREMDGVLANLIHAFVRLGAVGSNYLPALGRAIDDVTERFANWVDKGVNDGSIQRMIDRAIEGFKSLGRIIADVGAGFGSLFSAFNKGLTGGGGTLEALERVSQAFRELAASNEAQAAFKALGEVVKAAGDAFRLVLTTAVRELGPVIVDLAPFLQELVTVIGERLARAIQFVAPYLREFAQFLSENKETIAPIAATLLRLAAAFKVLQLAITAGRAIATAFAAIVAAAARVRTAIAALPALWARLQAVFARLLPVLARLAPLLARILIPVAVVTGLVEAAKALDKLNIAAAGGDPANLTGMAEGLHDLVAAGGQILSLDFAGIFRDIGAEWEALVATWSRGEAPVQQVFAKIRDSFQRDFLDFFSNAFVKIKDSFQRDFIDVFANLPATIGAAFAGVGAVVSAGIDGIISFFTGLPGRITASLSGLDATVSGFFRIVMTTIGTIVSTGVTAVVNFFGQLPGRISAIVAGLLATVVGGFTTMMSSASAAVSSGIASIISFFTNLRAQAASIIANVSATVTNGFRTAMSSAAAAVSSGISSIIGFFNNLRSQAASIIASVASTVTNGFRTAMSSAASAVSSGIGTIVGFFRSLPGQILGIISGLAGQLYASGSRMMSSFADGIRAAGAQALAAARAAVAAVRSVFPFSPAKTGPFSGRGYVTFSGQALVNDFADAIRRNIPAATAAAAALARATSGALDPTISITSAFEAAQLARAQAQTASRNLLGTAVNQVTAVATREPAAPVTNVTVLLSREQISEIARVVVENSQRETARRVGAGSGVTF